MSSIRRPAPWCLCFGSSVAISGSSAVVGDPYAFNQWGAAYAFNATTGALVATLANPWGGAWFGYSVAISGTCAVVGLPCDYLQYPSSYAGAGYVFNATTGARVATLINPTPADWDRFGYSVAISGTIAVVGAPYDDTSTGDSGSAYVFNVTNGAQSATMARPAAVGDNFGYSVAISGSNTVIGAQADDNGGADSGSAYIYATSGTKVATLANPAPAQSDIFGSSVAISGTSAVVGAPYDDGTCTDQGAAFVFNATTGALSLTLANPTPVNYDDFGYSVAISGNYVVVGAPYDDTGYTDSGSAYVFNATTGALVTTLANPTPAASDAFGYSVAISGTTVVVGAPNDDTGTTDSGTAYVFSTTGTLLATLAKTTRAASDNFGKSVAISGNIAVVGAPNDDTGATDAGRAFVFNATAGTLVANLSNPTPVASDMFGASVAIWNNTAVVGIPYDDTVATDAGLAYVFNASSGALAATLNNPTPWFSEHFGASVAIDAGKAIVGTPLEVPSTSTGDRGAAYIFDANSPPSLAVIESSALAYTENDAATAVTSTLTAADANDLTLSSATIQITSNYQNAQDVLSFTNTASITGTWNAATGTMVLSGSDTVANYQAALRAVKYQNSSDNPNTSTRTVSFKVNDGLADSATVTRNITVTAVNDSPVLTAIEGTAFAYTENGAATAITSTTTAADVDNTNISGATIQITGNYQNGQDVLSFAPTGSITGTWTAATGAMVLSGSDTLANYQAALRAVKYQNTSDNPSTLTRIVTFNVNDGAADSNLLTRNITVTAVNDAPVLAAIEGTALAYTENDAATAITSTTTASDPDNANLAGATIQITGNYQNGQDVLSFAPTGSITGTWTAATGTMVLSGSDTLANYQAALRAVKYQNTSESPSVLTRTVTIKVNDGTVDSNLITRNIAVAAVNDTPTNISLAGSAVAENQPVGTVVGTLSTTDPDTGDTFTYSLVTGTGSTDNGSFTISGNQLKTAALFDYEAKNAYAIRLRTTDQGSLTYEKTFTISVTNVNEMPTAMTGGPYRIDTNTSLPLNASASTDPDLGSGDVLTYAWDINNDGVWTDATGVNPTVAYSTLINTLHLAGAGVYTIGLKVTDSSGLNSTATTTLYVYDNQPVAVLTVNPSMVAPMQQVTLDGSGSYHGRPIDHAIVKYEWDFDGNGTTDYTETAASAPDGAFDGKVRYAYPTFGTFNARLTVTDNDGTPKIAYATRVVSVNQGNHAPIAAAGGPYLINQGSSVTFNGSASTDPDAAYGDTIVAYAWDLQGDGSYEYIGATPTVPWSGLSSLTMGTPVTVRLQVTDSFGASSTVATTLTINQPPTDLTLSATTVAENQASGTTVGTLSATDPDTGNTFTYSLVTGTGSTDNGSFTISGNQLKTAASFDYETKNSYAIRVQTKDQGGLVYEKTFTINVTNVNEAPVLAAIEGSALAYTENNPATAITSTTTATDVDNANLASATIQITGNYQNGQDLLSFTPMGSITGVWTAATGTMVLSGSDTLANYQAALRAVKYQNTSESPNTSTRTVTFKVNDGSLDSAVATRNITVTAVNDLPVLAAIEGTALVYTENLPAWAITSTVTTSDLDNTNLAGATIQITGNYQNGQDVLSFAPIGSITGTWTAATGTMVLSGSDTLANYQAALRAVKYQNTSDNPNTSTRTVTFRVNDGTADSASVTRNITITAVNDAPVLAAVEGTALAYTENDAATAITATTTASDLDNANMASATIQITGNYQNGQDVLSFAPIGSIMGTWTAATGTMVLSGSDTLANYQAALRAVKYQNTSDSPSVLTRTVTIKVNDGAVDSNLLTRNIAVTAVNDAPTNISPTSFTVAENQPSGTAVATLSTTDPDIGDTFTYSLVSGAGSADNGSFTISGSQLKTTAIFDFEGKSSYAIRLRTTDQGGAWYENAFTVSVTNVNETPTDLTVSPASIAENQPAGTVVGTLSTTDPDASNTFTYTFVTGTGSTDNGSFTISGSQLKTAASFDYETKNSYSIRVRTTDQGTLYFEKALTIAVTDVFENNPPVARAGGPYTVGEGGTVTLTGAASSDPDTGDTLTYAWDLDNNGSYETAGMTPTFSAAGMDGPTSRTVGLRVTDSHAAVSTATTTVNVINLEPTANAGGPYTINESYGVTLSGSGSDPGGDAISYAWDLNFDGLYDDSYVASPTLSWSQVAALHLRTNGQPSTLRLKVTDKDGASGAATALLRINNLPPVVDAGADQTKYRNTVVTFSGSATDPGGDSFTAQVWDFRDGSPTATGPTASHIYTTNGSYMVRYTVTDSDGATAYDELKVIVINPPNDVNVDKVIHDAGRSQTDDDRQRSTITRLQVVFTGLIDTCPVDAFHLSKDGGGSIPLLTPTKQTVNGVSVVTLRFDSCGSDYRRIGGYALNDGKYTLVIDGTKIQAAATVNGATDQFFRLFGDSDGDRDVDSVDQAAFRQAMSGSSASAGLRAAFDYDGDGDVDSLDYSQFCQRLGRRI
jgi:hypothetical protein